MTLGLDLRDVEMVLRVAELGSITRAAAALNIVQPALTRHLQRVEATLGAPLFVRLPRGVRLTPAGQLFLEHGRRMLREFEHAREAIAAQRGAAEGAVALGLSPSVAPVLLPELVERLRAEAPGVALSVREGFSPALLDALLQGGVDLAVLTNPPPSRALRLTPLLAEPIVLLSRPVRRGIRPKASLAELARTPVLVSSGIRRIVEEQLEAQGARLLLDLEVDSLEAIRRMALRGGGTAIMPISTFGGDVEAGALQAVEVAGVNLHRLLVVAQRGVEPDVDDGGGAPSAVLRVLRRCVSVLVDRGAFALPARRSARPAEDAAPG
jgi:LysR family transcriptional regulator, nitrogen assimilation regulatory protein